MASQGPSSATQLQSQGPSKGQQKKLVIKPLKRKDTRRTDCEILVQNECYAARAVSQRLVL